MAVYMIFFRSSEDSLVVYCAHDAMFSESVLKNFEKETGIHVAVRYDTEATKSLGLVELIKREKDNPRCDIFWNNELLGIVELADMGLLEPYKGEGYKRIPEQYRDPDGMWVGFGARLRMYIINKDKMPATYEAVDALLKSNDLSQVAIAKPIYGTTLTQYCVMWDEMGPDGLKEWHKSTRARGIRELLGNSTTREAVESGQLVLGYTDTDDYF